MRILVAEQVRLFRGALVALIGLEPDLEVVADVGRGEDVVRTALALRPDVAVIDATMRDRSGFCSARQLHQSLPSCRTLLLTGPSWPGSASRARDAHASGCLLKECTPEQLHAAIRNIASGRQVFDARAMAPPGNAWAQLSAREHDILQLTADGARPQEIADTLSLSVGTVRNYLAAIVQKLGARSRPNAVSKAYTAGLLS